MHTGEITALAHENGKLISGARDGKLVISATEGGRISQEKVIEIGSESHPKAIDYFKGKILVGLRNGTIVEISESNPEVK